MSLRQFNFILRPTHKRYLRWPAVKEIFGTLAIISLLSSELQAVLVSGAVEWKKRFANVRLVKRVWSLLYGYFGRI